MERGKKDAQETIEALGMAALFKENKCWDNPPIPTLNEMDAEQEDDEGLSQVVKDSVHKLEPYTSQDTEDVAPSIQQLAGGGIIDRGLNTHLIFLYSAAFKRLPSTDLPLMITKSKHCPYA